MPFTEAELTAMRGGLTAEEYRSIAGAGWIVGMALAAIGLSANGFVTVVLIRRGREFA